jgi:hypothetical protein
MMVNMVAELQTTRSKLGMEKKCHSDISKGQTDLSDQKLQVNKLVDGFDRMKKIEYP